MIQVVYHCHWGANCKLQLNSSIDWSCYFKLEWGGKSHAALELGWQMRNGLGIAPHKTILPCSRKDHRVFLSRCVRLQLSLAYLAYIEMCKITRVPWQTVPQCDEKGRISKTAYFKRYHNSISGKSIIRVGVITSVCDCIRRLCK